MQEVTSSILVLPHYFLFAFVLSTNQPLARLPVFFSIAGILCWPHSKGIAYWQKLMTVGEAKICFPAGIRTRVLWVKATYPNRLDYEESLLQVEYAEDRTGRKQVSHHLFWSFIVHSGRHA